MMCRFELEFAGKAYPRSCPTCGLSGKCVNGYEQIRQPPAHDPSYIIVNSLGLTKEQVDKEAEANTGHSAPKPHPFMAPAVSFKPASVGIRTTRVQRARIMDRIEQALHDAKADLNSHSVEKETEQLTKDILDILNAS